MESIFQDLRHVIRGLVRTPGFTVAATLTLALGIGANTAIFSLVDALLFRPLPYRDSHQLATLLAIEDRGRSRPSRTPAVELDKLGEWRTERSVFQDIAGYHRGRMLPEGSNGEPIAIGRFSSKVLDVLGVSPALGRGFEESEMASGADAVAIISHFAWVTMFGADANVLGKTITLDGRLHTIVAVMPSSFRFPDLEIHVWLPLESSEDAPFAVARVAPGISVREAQQRANVIAQRLQEQKPRRGGWVIELQGMEESRGDAAILALIPFAAGGLLVLVACANVAGLILARTTRRQKELGIRAALGGSRSRVLRHVLLEGVVVALVGGALAAVAAMWTIQAFSTQLPADFVRFDNRVLAFALVVSLAAGLVCSAVPALRATRVNLVAVLAGSARALGGTREHQRFRFALVAIEVAVTFVLLLGAGLLTNSLLRMLRVDAGFDTRNLVAMDVRLPIDRYPNRAAEAAFQEEVLGRLKGLPGVEAVTVGGLVPPRDGVHFEVIVEDAPSTSPVNVVITPVALSYFDTLGIPLLEGRPFGSTDSRTSEPVIAIGREMARTLWPNRSPLGQRLRIRSEPPMTVIGVVGDVKTSRFNSGSLKSDFQAYVPMTQRSSLIGSTFAARTADDPAAALRNMRRIVNGLDARAMIRMASTVDDSYAALLRVPRNTANLVALFALGAFALAAIGIYGLVAYSVAQRTQEIGVRMALGADSRAVTRMVVREALLPAAIGLLVGFVASLGSGQLMGRMLYQLSPYDPTTTILVAGFLIAAIAIVAWIPAQRATRLDPVAALRAD